MNNPENLPIDLDEQRAWLNAKKAETGLPWTDLGKQIGVAHQTLAAFANAKYAGDNRNVAEHVYRWRQALAQRASIEIEAPTMPSYFETPTSRRITAHLSFAQTRGRITLVATEPGMGKTEAMKNYALAMPNVWVATMAPSTAGVNNMQIEVLASMGEDNARGTPQALTRRIRKQIGGTGGLIAIDEAQNLTEKALDELRGWNDATGIGICMLGNTDVLNRLETGSRKAALARLASRVGQYMVAVAPVAGDALAQADAWKISDEAARRFLVELVTKRPGGLRTGSYVLETASMLAASEGQPLMVNHLQEAWSLRASRQIAA